MGELQEALFVCKLTRHSIVSELKTMPPQLFYRATSESLSEGTARGTRLGEEQANLASRIVFENSPSPEELGSALQVLRLHEGSFFRFFSKEYRSTRRQLAAYLRGSLPRAIPEMIDRLEELKDWQKKHAAFEADDDLRQTFGPYFRGAATDWEKCKTLYQWAVTAQSKGIDHSRACGLLERRNGERLPTRRFSQCVNALAAELESSEVLSLLGFNGKSPVTDIPLPILEQRASFLYESLVSLEENASAFTVNPEDSLLDIRGFCGTLQRVIGLHQEIADSDRWELLGSWYASVDTVNEKLEQALGWVRGFASLGIPPQVQDKLIDGEPSGNLTQLADQLDELSLLLEQWRGKQKIFGDVLAWLELAGERLGKALAHPLAIRVSEADSLKQVAERCGRVVAAERLQRQIVSPQAWEPLGGLFQKGESDKGLLRASADWADHLAKLALPEKVTAWLAERETASRCRQFEKRANQYLQHRQDWLRNRERFDALGEVSTEWMPWSFLADIDEGLSPLTEKLAANFDELPAWAAFCRVLQRCRSVDLGDFCEAVLEGKVAADQIGQTYRLTVLDAVTENAVGDSDELLGFSRIAIEGARRKYQELDRELLLVNRKLIAYKAAKHKPPWGVSSGRVGEYTELGLILHEVQKQRRHCRIRDLLTRAGTAVQGLKPCFMMSPLSVSQYLAPEGVQFDLVVMDEASQVKPEDAIGVLLRAKQIVVVGDPKQLPPSSYFDKIGSDVDEDAATQFDNTESILEVATKSFQPVRRLRWHYRSLHESLIQFSNDRFYDGDLVVFPSPSTDEGSLGLRYHFVEGATFRKGVNQEEAEQVARAIVKHAIERPHESLAVGAFNATQSGLIQDLLERLCMEDGEARLAVEKLGEREKLLIKNLENLQGDERDVVFLSYTYGPDPASGRVMNRFGPITGEAGWRRLNVLISRARKRVELFTSIQPGDIQLGAGKSRGVLAFRDYLEYVQTGFLPDRAQITNRPMESPFEEAVARVVTALGLEAVPQVGVAGYFIDLGIRLPGEEDFLLGVECDGATYHSSKSARDRDRLREEVIRSRGWELHRIWSTDWYFNQKHEEDRLSDRLLLTLNGKA